MAFLVKFLVGLQLNLSKNVQLLGQSGFPDEEVLSLVGQLLLSLSQFVCQGLLLLGPHLSLVERKVDTSKESPKAEGHALLQCLINRVSHGLLFVASQDLLEDQGKLRGRGRSRLMNTLGPFLDCKKVWR